MDVGRFDLNEGDANELRRLKNLYRENLFRILTSDELINSLNEKINKRIDAFARSVGASEDIKTLARNEFFINENKRQEFIDQINNNKTDMSQIYDDMTDDLLFGTDDRMIDVISMIYMLKEYNVPIVTFMYENVNPSCKIEGCSVTGCLDNVIDPEYIISTESKGVPANDQTITLDGQCYAKIQYPNKSVLCESRNNKPDGKIFCKNDENCQWIENGKKMPRPESDIDRSGNWYLPLDEINGDDESYPRIGYGMTNGNGNWKECQQRCLDTEGCIYFNAFSNGGCHVTDGSEGTSLGDPRPQYEGQEHNKTIASGSARSEETVNAPPIVFDQQEGFENINEESNNNDFLKILFILFVIIILLQICKK